MRLIKIRKGRLVEDVTSTVSWCNFCQGALPVQFVFVVQCSTSE